MFSSRTGPKVSLFGFLDQPPSGPLPSDWNPEVDEPTSADRPQAFGLTLGEIEELSARYGLPAYAAEQIARWLYARNASSFSEMTDLSRAARSLLDAELRLDSPGPLSVRESMDGTRKYLFGASGRLVESAFIPDGARATLCLSVQIGCRRRCRFCMTGRQSYRGNLTGGEIVNQYRGLPERDRVTNIVYMGMGEPMDNLDNVLRSLQILTAQWGYGLSPTRVTVSTVGILPAMETFLDGSDCNLAVSLHSPFPDERAALMPVEKAYPIREVLDVLRRHARGRGKAARRRVSFEYVALRDVNDTPRHAREILRIVRGIPCRVNLIGYHQLPDGDLVPSPRERMEQMQAILKRGGVMTTIRVSRGQDIEAACGMLSTRGCVAGAGT